jgi:hypothetical protein
MPRGFWRGRCKIDRARTLSRLLPLQSQHYSTVRLSSGTCEPSVLEHEATAPISAITSTKAPLSQEVILFRTTSIRITHVLSTPYTVNELSCENAHEPQRIFTYWKSRLRGRDHTPQGGALATDPRKMGNMRLMRTEKFQMPIRRGCVRVYTSVY